MGWNKGYTIFESLTVKMYDAGKLDEEMLSIIMEQFRSTDIDEGGSHYLKAKDGKSAEEIVVSIFNPSGYESVVGLKKKDPDRFSERLYTLFEKVTYDKFGWR